MALPALFTSDPLLLLLRILRKHRKCQKGPLRKVMKYLRKVLRISLYFFVVMVVVNINVVLVLDVFIVAVLVIIGAISSRCNVFFTLFFQEKIQIQKQI